MIAHLVIGITVPWAQYQNGAKKATVPDVPYSNSMEALSPASGGREQHCGVVGMDCAVEGVHEVLKVPVIPGGVKLESRMTTSTRPDTKGVNQTVPAIEGIHTNKLISIHCLVLGLPPTTKPLEGVTNTLEERNSQLSDQQNICEVVNRKECICG